MRALNYRQVVTSFIQSNENKILLLQRSSKVGTNRGKWGAVSGYLEANEKPFSRAQIEIQEEASLQPNEIELTRSGTPLRAFDEENQIVWIVHPYLFATHNDAIIIDWEHTNYKWIDPRELDSYDTVPKLKETFERVQWDLRATSQRQQEALEMICKLDEDRVSGASFLGRCAVQIIANHVKSSEGTPRDDIFRDMLSLFMKSRTVQHSMASVRNMTGKLMFQSDLIRAESKSTDDFRYAVLESAQKISSNSEKESEYAADNLASIIAQNAKILTHSYSSTVKHAFESMLHRGIPFEVFVTESIPGYEGKALARDLIETGLRARVVSDSNIPKILEQIDIVVVGADTVLADGSVVNKVGTKHIAVEAKLRHVPFYVVCESGKFSTENFLGENIQLDDMFDVTSDDLVQKIVTELGVLEPSQVCERIKIMLRELYT